jgi:hypothetical protein
VGRSNHKRSCHAVCGRSRCCDNTGWIADKASRFVKQCERSVSKRTRAKQTQRLCFAVVLAAHACVQVNT